MKILILGGGIFVGRHILDAALLRGHQITVFNRGRRKDWPAGIEKLTGDRHKDLSALKNGDWDSVVDTCAYRPRDIRKTLAALPPSINRYLFISSISVYADFANPRAEDDPLATTNEPEAETITGENYGPLKALAENELQSALGDKATIIRPGLIVGPDDPTDRFTYWPARFDRAGDQPVLAPGPAEQKIQIVDVRDLADFAIDLIENAKPGAYNAISPPGQWTFKDLLEACVEASGQKRDITWAEPERLLELEVQPWSELPLWVPASPEQKAFAEVSDSKARGAGLKTRKLEDIVADTLDWHRQRKLEPDQALSAGLSPSREAELLKQL